METDYEKRLKDLEMKFTDLEASFWRKLGNGSNSVSTNVGDFAEIHVKGVIRTVKLGDSIQAAIDYVNDRGGGEVRLATGTYTLTDDITIYSNIALIGAGYDSTILEFSGSANGILAIGASSPLKKNWIIKNLTVQNSNNTAGIDVDYSDAFIMENIRVTSCDQKGIRIQRSQRFILINTDSDLNTGNGIELVGDAARAQAKFSLINCDTSTNGGIGFAFTSAGTKLFYFSVFNCRATGNTGDGFDLAAASGTPVFDASFINCFADVNAIGFDSDVSRVTFLGCFAENNSGDGFEITGLNNRLVGIHSSDSIDIQNTTTFFIGNSQNNAQVFKTVTLANGDNNDVDFSTLENIRIAGPSAAFAITGIAKPYGGAIVRIYNTTSQAMTISHQSASSSAANRITTSTGADVATTGVGMATLVYDDIGDSWLLMSIET